jgi:hypothetical protein
MKKVICFLSITFLFTTVKLHSQNLSKPWYAQANKGVTSELLYSSDGPGFMSSVPINYFIPPNNGPGLSWYYENAEDFEIPLGENWSVGGFFVGGFILPNVTNITFFDVRIYNSAPGEDPFGKPVEVPVVYQRVTNFQNFGIPEFAVLSLQLDNPVVLSGGQRYWVSFTCGTNPASFGPGFVSWFTTGPGLPAMGPGSSAAFCTRYPAASPSWFYGPTFYDPGVETSPDLVLAITGGKVPNTVPLAGWMIPSIFGMILLTMIIRYRRT